MRERQVAVRNRLPTKDIFIFALSISVNAKKIAILRGQFESRRIAIDYLPTTCSWNFHSVFCAFVQFWLGRADEVWDYRIKLKISAFEIKFYEAEGIAYSWRDGLARNSLDTFEG